MMQENDFEYVDLGLQSGTMWPTCNVGADKPKDPGLLFQFGRVDGYKYDDKNNKFKTNQQNLEDGSTSEYIPVTSSGKVYNENDILDLEDDTAHVHMGGKWKMPTFQQYQELYDNTNHIVIKDPKNNKNNVCMLFTSNINGKQLFIPFAGYWYNGTFHDIGSSVSVWSSQVRSSNVYRAYNIYCDPASYDYIDDNFHTHAFSIRGVFKK